MKAIATSYWRSIKRGARSFESVKDDVKDDVKALAAMDVKARVITEMDYQKHIGEEYPEMSVVEE